MKKLEMLTKELVSRNFSNSFGNFLSYLPNPDKILKRTGKTIEVYRDLKTDAHLWSCIQSRKSGLISLDYRIIENHSGQYITKEIENIFSDLDMQRIERDILEAPLFGYQPLEIFWKIIGNSKKIIIPIDIQAKPQEWFYYDIEGKLRYKKSASIEGEVVPQYKILCVQYEHSYMNPYGHSLLSKCYWPITFKNGGLKFWVTFTEKYGMPILMGQYTRGATFEESERLAEALADMTQDSVIVAPADININLHEAVRNSSVDLYKELIKYCNAEISKAILSQTLTTELDMGSYAAAQTHFKVRQEVIQSDKMLVEATMNKVIRMIVDLNFATKSYPKFQLVSNKSNDAEQIERDLKISQTGYVRLSKKYWQKTYGFKEDEIELC